MTRFPWLLVSGTVLAVTVAMASPARAAGEIHTVTTARDLSSIAVGGTVVPLQEVRLTAQLPGRVETLAGQEGERFSAGTLLVALDDSELQAERASAVAAMQSADAAARNAHMEYNRERVDPRRERPGEMSGMALPGMMDKMFSRPMGNMMGMEDRGLNRGADLYQRGSQVSQAQSAVAQARARVEQIDARIRDTRSVAPFDGTITAKHVEVGDTVQPGQPLLTFANLHRLQVRSDVPARLGLALREGQMVETRIDRLEPVPTRVAQVFPVADARRHTVVVKFDLAPGAPAAPGMYVDVLLPNPDGGGSELPVVPRQALVWRGSLPGVMKLDDDDVPRLKLIRISDRGDPARVGVVAGLKAGDRILARPE